MCGLCVVVLCISCLNVVKLMLGLFSVRVRLRTGSLLVRWRMWRSASPRGVVSWLNITLFDRFMGVSRVGLLNRTSIGKTLCRLLNRCLLSTEDLLTSLTLSGLLCCP